MTVVNPLRSRGFSLIELLVVISVVALLVGILLPALSAARKSGRVSTCLSNLRQLGIGVHTYGNDFEQRIPRGPSIPPPLSALFGATPANEGIVPDYASSTIWLGQNAVNGVGVTVSQSYYTAHGTMLQTYLKDERSMFCPGDDTRDPVQELANIGNPNAFAFSSYNYRQLDQTTDDLIDRLGENDNGDGAEMLAFDSNSSGAAGTGLNRSNHERDPANLMFRDGSAESANNADETFTIRGSDYAGGWAGLSARLDAMLIAGDARR